MRESRVSCGKRSLPAVSANGTVASELEVSVFGRLIGVVVIRLCSSGAARVSPCRAVPTSLQQRGFPGAAATVRRRRSTSRNVRDVRCSSAPLRQFRTPTRHLRGFHIAGNLCRAERSRTLVSARLSAAALPVFRRSGPGRRAFDGQQMTRRAKQEQALRDGRRRQHALRHVVVRQ